MTEGIRSRQRLPLPTADGDFVYVLSIFERYEYSFMLLILFVILCLAVFAKPLITSAECFYFAESVQCAAQLTKTPEESVALLPSKDLRISKAPSVRMSKNSVFYWNIAPPARSLSSAASLPQSIQQDATRFCVFRSLPGHRGLIFYALPPPLHA